MTRRTAARASSPDRTRRARLPKTFREKYFSVPGDSIEIDAYSPVTGKTYTMSCIRNGQVVTCRGGNEAVVTFSVG